MKIRALLFLAILGSLAAPQARATSLVRLSLEQLSQASTEIVRGHVISQESVWNSKHTQILTLTTVAVAETLKGSPQTTLVVQQMGGVVDNVRVLVPGTVHFHNDTDYLLFLEPAGSDPSRFLVVGMLQGAFRIYRDTTSGEERVISSFAGVLERSQTSKSKVRVSDQAYTLRGFRQYVVGALRAPIVIPPGTSIPLAVESAEPQGFGRIQVLGRTTASLFPSATVVIPAGSSIEGTAQQVSGVWKIQWTSVSIRGARVEISAASEGSGGESLKGRALAAEVK